MIESAVNYNPEACLGRRIHVWRPFWGCTDAASPYFDPEANTETALGGPLSSDALGAGGFPLQ